MELLFEFDVRFDTKVPRKYNLSCLLTVQNTHRRALSFIDNREFTGFFTRIKLSSIYGRKVIEP